MFYPFNSPSFNHVVVNGLALFLYCVAGVAESNPAASISFEGIGGQLLSNVRANVRLVSQIENKDPISNAEWQRLRGAVPSQVREALEVFGYYNVGVSVRSSATGKKLTYIVTLNAPVVIDRISLNFNDDAKQQADFQTWLREFPLKSGSRLDQIAYEEAKKQLSSTALRLGYFDARFIEHKIVVNQARTAADISLAFDSGARYKISDINVIWLNPDGERAPDHQGLIADTLLGKYIKLIPGDYINAESLSRVQSALLATPYFSSVQVQADASFNQVGAASFNEGFESVSGTSNKADMATNFEADKVAATRSIVIRLTPSKRHAFNAALGAGTDTGPRGSVGYENRRINTHGHNLSARFGGSSIERTAIVNYRIPLQGSARESINLFSSYEDESSDNRVFDVAKLGAEWSTTWNDAVLNFGVVASRERFVASDGLMSDFSTLGTTTIDDEKSTDLLIPSVRWEKRVSDDLYFPQRGWSASLNLSAASDSLYSDTDLIQLKVNTKLLYPLGSGRIKARLALAGTDINDVDDLPSSLGFLAGGDESIRGYRFESIGQQRGGVVGVAKNLVVGSIEYQHPIKNGFALASFIDIGDAFDESPNYKRGLGFGVRWRLPFGALKLDAASALDLEGKPIRLHFSFGTDL